MSLSVKSMSKNTIMKQKFVHFVRVYRKCPFCQGNVYPSYVSETSAGSPEADPGLFKRGGAKIRPDRPSTSFLWEGMSLRSGEKNVIFKVNWHDLVHSFYLRCWLVSGAISLQKIEGAHAPLNPPLASTID